MKKIIYFISAFLFVSCVCTEHKSITLESLLEEMTDPYSSSEWPSVEYECLQASSYDRKSIAPGNPAWFANADGFGYERVDTVDGRVEKILLDEKHPGVITRIWITTHTPKAILRFYFDGEDIPGWVVNAYDLTEFGLKALENNPLLLTHTSYEKGVKGGQTFFLPIPYSKGLKITLEDPYTEVPRYYQINYRRYPDETSIESFSTDVALRASKDVVKAGERLAGQVRISGKKYKEEATLSAGETLTLELPEGEKAIRKICFDINCPDSAKYAQTMREFIFTAEFDGVQCINLPISDYSAGGLGAPEVRSRQLIADGKGEFISYWVMPYAENATLKLINTSDLTCYVRLSAVVENHEFTENTMYFHASWNKGDALPVSPDHNICKEWTFTSIEGRGNYVGDVLTLFNHAPAWYGEGDEKIYVDGEDFPSHFGTGTEDYYNSSWAPVIVFHTPFGGAPRADQESSHGYNTFFRTRLLDNIPFGKSLKYDLELISWNPGSVDYASTAYWYGDLNTSAVVSSDPLLERYELPDIPADPARYYLGGIEFEKTAIHSKPERIMTDRQGMSGFPDGKWSGAKQLTCFGGQPGDQVSFIYDDIENGVYECVMHATKAGDYGKVLYSLNGKKVYEFDGYDAKVTNSGPIYLGECTVTDGSLKLDVTISGKNESSAGYMFGLDCFEINRK